MRIVENVGILIPLTIIFIQIMDIVDVLLQKNGS